MNNDQIKLLLAKFSATERASFNGIMLALEDCHGDVTQLPEHLRLEYEQLKSKYEAFGSVDAIQSLSTQTNGGIGSAASAQHQAQKADIDSPFSLYVRNVLHRELCKNDQDMQYAINYAFDHKWLPNELKNKEICETKFKQYEQEIVSLNQWREEFDKSHDSLNEKTMAVGLAWFMKVYQLKQHYFSHDTGDQ